MSDQFTWLTDEQPEVQDRIADALDQPERNEFRYHWNVFAREEQLAPDGAGFGLQVAQSAAARHRQVFLIRCVTQNVLDQHPQCAVGRAGFAPGAAQVFGITDMRGHIKAAGNLLDVLGQFAL